jgi:hypothetical protein
MKFSKQFFPLFFSLFFFTQKKGKKKRGNFSSKYHPCFSLQREKNTKFL